MEIGGETERGVRARSRLVLLDEPTAALSVKETHHVEELILRLRANDVAIVLCDRLVVLRHDAHRLATLIGQN